MVAGERELKTQEQQRLVYFKSLWLISPQKAAELGLPAEAPVFVSPYQWEIKQCSCGAKYGPLVYGPGAPIEAHHFHDFAEGGIYFDKSINGPNQWDIYANGNWIAIIEPLGPVDRDRAKAVLVKQIMAVCAGSCHILEKGFLVGTDAEPFSGILLPVCSLEEHSNFQGIFEPAFKFKIEDGQVLFSQV